MALSFAQIEQLWISAGGNPSAAPNAAAIAMAESQGNPSAVNPNDNNGKQTSWGLFQISDGTHNAPAAWDNPMQNTKMAVAKYNAAGGTFSKDWGTYGTPTYYQNLTQAFTALPQAITGAWNWLNDPNSFPANVLNGANTTAQGGGNLTGGLLGLHPFNAKDWAPLFVGIGILIIGAVIILSNHPEAVTTAAKAAAV